MTTLMQSSQELRTRMPSGLSDARPHVRTANWFDPFRIAAITAGPPVPIWSIPRKPRHLRLRHPLAVRIWTEEGLVFVENDTLQIFATGVNLDEALRDFCLHVLEFYEHYKALPSNRAMGEALRHKALVKDLFIES